METKSSDAIVKPFSYRDDAKAVLGIEQQVYGQPWTSEDLQRCSRPSCGGFIAKQRGKVVGYVFYEVKGGVIEIANIAVDPDHQRCKIATRLLNSLKEQAKVLGDGYASSAKIKCYVRETALPLQLCLKANSFWATKVIPRHFEAAIEDDRETAFRMDYPKPLDPVPATTRKTRRDKRK